MHKFHFLFVVAVLFSGASSVLLGAPPVEVAKIQLFGDNFKAPYAETVARSVVRLESGGSGVVVSPKFVLTMGHTAREETVDAHIHEAPAKWKTLRLKRRFSLRADEIADFAVYEIVDGKADTWIPIDINMDFTNRPDVRYQALGFSSRDMKRESTPGPQPPKVLSADLTLANSVGLGFEDPEQFRDRVTNRGEPGAGTMAKRWLDYPEKGNLISFAAQASKGMSGGPVIRITDTNGKPSLSVVALVSGGEPYRERDNGAQNARAYTVSHLRDYLTVFDPGLSSELGLPASLDREVPSYLLEKQDANLKGYLRDFRVENKTVEFVHVFSLKLGPGCHLKNVKFRYVTFVGTDFSDCIFENVSFEKVVFDTETKWPQGYVVDKSANLGPLVSPLTKDVSHSIRSVSNQNLDGVFIPHYFDLSGMNFKNVSLRGSIIDGHAVGEPRSGNDYTLEGCDLQGANIHTYDGHTKFEPKLINSNLRGANIGGGFGGVGDYDVSHLIKDSKMDQFTVARIGDGLESLRDLPGRNRTAAGFYFTRGKEIPSEIIDSPQLRALRQTAGPRDWSEGEKHAVEKLLEQWSAKFPQFIGAFDGAKVNLRRIKAFPVFTEKAPYVLPSAQSGFTEQAFYLSDGDGLYKATIDILLPNNIFIDGLNVNGVPKYALTLFHELVHARDRLFVPWRLPETPDMPQIMPFSQPLPPWKSERLLSETKTAWERYLSLKRQGRDQEALDYSYSYATKHGMPSIYSMVTDEQWETKADLLAYGALDPAFSKYAHPAVVKAVNTYLGYIGSSGAGSGHGIQPGTHNISGNTPPAGMGLSRQGR